jgi:GT2 family glycosyltransferase/glycosyltransferase involved in cell wall biosynthesis
VLGAPSADLPRCCAIVPVYNGLSDLKLCIASLIRQLEPERIRAIVIDDASPDPAVGEFLAQLEQPAGSQLTILRNKRNLGFIGTVNRAFSLLEPDEDAIIVNADTILPHRAILRLARHCHATPGIASVTPMSNKATILSFPSPAAQNAPLVGLTTAEIDFAFHGAADELGSSPVEVPTGIGFCMYMRRRALDEVGPFSTEWGRGYCEEVDWCLSARDLGWRHLVATDTFVMHEGSVSFGNERLKLIGDNHLRLEQLYPEYLGEIGAFAASDPLAELRIGAFARLVAKRVRLLTIEFTHGLGGGTQRYIESLDKLARGPHHEMAVITPFADGGDRLRLILGDATNAPLDFPADYLLTLLVALERCGVRLTLHVNSRLSFSRSALDVISSGRWPYIVTLHDFQWYCPRVTLTDLRHFYCGEPPASVCQDCVRGPGLFDFGDQNALIDENMFGWLSYNRQFLEGASRIIAPSMDTADRYRQRFGLTEIAVMTHPDLAVGRAGRRFATRERVGDSLRIVVVGAIVSHKGYSLLLRLAERAARAQTGLLITIVGDTIDNARISRVGNVRVVGRYQPDELGARIRDYEPDFVFLASVWPETFSYVLSEVLLIGYPVVAFDFGAPAERIRAHGGGLLIPPTNDPDVLLVALYAARDRLQTVAPYRPSPPYRPTLESYLGLEADSVGERAP